MVVSEPRVLRGPVPSGSVDGSGYGYGSVDGSGYGYGYGYGSGYGSGYGYGDGDGSGSGSGDGSGYWQVVLRSNAADHEKRGAMLAFWKSDAEGRPANHASIAARRSEPARVGLIQEVPGPLRLCSGNALHATLDPSKWSGSRLWLVALWGEVSRDDDDSKLGALKREIVAEIKGVL